VIARLVVDRRTNAEIAAHFANALFPSAENILYVLLWGSVGLALLTRADTPAEPPVRHPAQVG
jgi:hypothetical protein